MIVLLRKFLLLITLDFFDGWLMNYPLQVRLKNLNGNLDKLYEEPFHECG